MTIINRMVYLRVGLKEVICEHRLDGSRKKTALGRRNSKYKSPGGGGVPGKEPR
jgi:hypothetical protein